MPGSSPGRWPPAPCLLCWPWLRCRARVIGRGCRRRPGPQAQPRTLRCRRGSHGHHPPDSVIGCRRARHWACPADDTPIARPALHAPETRCQGDDTVCRHASRRARPQKARQPVSADAGGEVRLSAAGHPLARSGPGALSAGRQTPHARTRREPARPPQATLTSARARCLPWLRPDEAARALSWVPRSPAMARSSHPWPTAGTARPGGQRPHQSSVPSGGKSRCPPKPGARCTEAACLPGPAVAAGCRLAVAAGARGHCRVPRLLRGLPALSAVARLNAELTRPTWEKA